MNKKLTDIQSKLDKLASDNEMLQSKIIVGEKTTKTLQENLTCDNSKITELERSVHKLEQYTRRECVEIAGIPPDIPHVILEGVAIKSLNKTDVNLTKNDFLACHRLANSGRAIIKVLNRKHAEKIMNNKSKLKGMYFSDISSIVEASVNSPQNREISEFILITFYVSIIGFYMVKSRKSYRKVSFTIFGFQMVA